MGTSDDPVKAAIEERRARRVVEQRLESGVTLADRFRTAAERRLRVRAFLIGGTSVAGTALAADDHVLTLAGSTGCVHLAVDALTRLTVADVGARVGLQPAVETHATGLARTVAELARRGSDLTITTRDGSTLSGSVVSLGEATIGFVAGRRRADRDEAAGAPGGSIDWVDPAQIVAVTELG